MFIIIRRIIALIFLLMAIGLVAWAAVPSRRQVLSRPINFVVSQIPTGNQGSASFILEPRRVNLEWPQSLRIGEVEQIILTFSPELTQTVSPTQFTAAEKIYTSFNLMAEARYEVAGINVSPSNPTRESMPAGQSVKYTWNISTRKSGAYDGKVWLSLRLLPLDGRPASEMPVFIHELNIQAFSLFGMSVATAYIISGTGLVLGVGMEFNDIIRWIRKRMNKVTATPS